MISHYDMPIADDEAIRDIRLSQHYTKVH